jgi:hypothetical protein
MNTSERLTRPVLVAAATSTGLGRSLSTFPLAHARLSRLIGKPAERPFPAGKPSIKK